MALIFFTGFENEDLEGDYVYNLIQSGTQKRTGSYSGYSSGGSYPRLQLSYSGSEVTFIFGAAVYLTGTNYFLTFQLENSGHSPQCCVMIQATASGSGRITFRRGGYGGTILATGTTPIYTTTWYYVEAKMTVNNSTGAAIVKVDEAEDINVSGVDSQLQSTDEIGYFIFGLNENFGNYYFYIDDLYLLDTTGSVNNDFLGPVKVEGIQPNGNGYNSDFTGSDADKIDNYLLVDEVPNDGDTTYVESDTVSDIDSFTYSNLTGDIGTIHGVKINSIAKKTDTYERNFENFVRISSTNYMGSEKVPSTSYNNYYDIWEENPNTSTGWTESDVNGLEAGITISS